MRNDLKLISMEDVQAEEVQWLWYPYIPLGKLTIVQGDPGEGKTTFVLAVVAAMAERAGCAVILIGHMNKAQGLKSGYRGLGSIDFRAAARSVLVVGRLKDDPTVRIVAQDKNSLAPEGKSIAFQLDGELGLQWKGLCELTVDDVLGGGGKLQTKATQMEEKLRQMLTETVPASSGN